MQINMEDSIQDIIQDLVSTGKYTEKEASEIALQAKVGYANFMEFETARRQQTNEFLQHLMLHPVLR